MDLGRALRSARQQRGWSQRELAQAAGVHRSVVERAETGSAPRWDVAMRLLDATGRGLALSLPEVPPDERLTGWLHASTSERLHWSIGSRQGMYADNHHPVWMALRRATDRWWVVVLDPLASVGVWLPDVPAPVPLPVTVIGPAVTSPELLVTHGPVRLEGLVPVGVSRWREVLVYPPDHPAMVLDAVTGARLRGVAALLDAGRPRDAQSRRPPAHRESDVRWEQGVTLSRRQWKQVPARDPDPRYRRDWRLGGEASFRAWLAARGFAVWELPGQRERG